MRLDRLLEVVGELPAFAVEELDAVVVVAVVRGADDDAEVAAESLHEVGDARSRQGPDEQHVDTRGDEAGLERGFEHVSREPRVLADQHPAALGRKHARGRARQAQRELDGHRMRPDPTAHPVRAEVPHAKEPLIYPSVERVTRAPWRDKARAEAP